jgi:TetR/AcrR family transcriptional regulator, copper-responsive repressor
LAITPEAVLERAVALFCAEGVEALSLNSLCAELGISKPALYRSFGGEDGLRRAALAHYFAVWMGPGFGQMDFTQPFAAQCEQLARMASHPDPKSPQSAGCLYTRMRLSRRVLGKQALNMVEELERGMKTQLTAWMEGIAQSGQLRPDLQAAEAAAYLDAQIMLALIQRGQGKAPKAVEAQLSLALSVLRA